MSCIYNTKVFAGDFFHKPTITSPSFHQDTKVEIRKNNIKNERPINKLILNVNHNGSNVNNSKMKYANTDISESMSKHITLKDTLNVTPIQIIEPYGNKDDTVGMENNNRKRRNYFKRHFIKNGINNSITNNSSIKDIKNVNESNYCVSNSERDNKEEQKPSTRGLINNDNNNSGRGYFLKTIKLPKSNNVIISAVSFSKNVPCLICNKIFPENTLICTNQCKHLFCQECIGDYFQNKILTSTIDVSLSLSTQVIKCPIYSCNETFNIDLIKQYISSQFTNYLLNNECPIKHCVDEYKIINSNNNNNNSINNNNRDVYLNKHIISINNNQSLYSYSNTKKEICPQCNLYSLYHKSGAKWLICLNCFHKYCYFCLHPYKANHFRTSNSHRCKILFRYDDQNTSTSKHLCHNTFLSKYIFSILFLIAGFFICWFGTIRNIKSFIHTSLFSKDTHAIVYALKKIIYYILITIISIIISALMLITFPYFAIIASM